jgi:hypothetical protein
MQKIKTKVLESLLSNLSIVSLATNHRNDFCLQRKKSFSIFPSPAGMSLTKVSLGGNNFLIPAQGEFGK